MAACRKALNMLLRLRHGELENGDDVTTCTVTKRWTNSFSDLLDADTHQTNRHIVSALKCHGMQNANSGGDLTHLQLSVLSFKLQVVTVKRSSRRMDLL